MEVTLALGIMAFAFTAVLGMLPVGLQAFRDATDKTQAILIAQKLLAEAQQTPFEDLSQLYDVLRYYDVEGEELSSSSPDFVYTAQIVPIESAVSVDNYSGVGISLDRTRLIRIRIARNKRVDSLGADDKPLAQYTYAIADVRL